MTQVKLDKALAEDLITSKLRILQRYIDEILTKYNESSSKDFLEKTRNGIYQNAEDDAVELRQLLLDYSKLQEILDNL
ncbi:hypothetical protein LCGC14_0519520 [marine sediment metagenome]|uniref:Uncharacterized protein n=1 Tax=marine sediment metagenome TaxID=412755 RepID=A0A0F9SH97_9ZZZZ|nr:MAG: hypothetical protein Lokiarch_48580 [Candidatus Lokiarchaeum sp. GC14_75]HEC36808.1 hypothetical protein [bacterium]